MTGLRARLSSAEFAEAAVLGALAAVLVAVGKLLPHVGFIEPFALVPFGVLGMRPRLRAAACGATAGGVIAVLVAGLGAGVEVLGLGVVGAFIGWVVRTGRGPVTVLAGGVAVGATAGLVIDIALLVFGSARDLAFAGALGVVDGVVRIVGGVPLLASAAGAGAAVAHAALASWWLWVPPAALVGGVLGMVGVWLLLRTLLVRLPRQGRPSVGMLRPAVQAAAPVPVLLRGARLDGGRPGGGAQGLDVAFAAAEFVVVTGANGAGKSTLLQLLAGAPATGGSVERPGGVALGEVGGTALLLQRPETQVLAMTVAEDVRWGLPAGQDVDVAALLEEVGLGGMEGRPTGGLSGGQLQRLALAAALARKPALLLSDESTAMIDADGRPGLVDLLASLPGRCGTTVVHVSHFANEAVRADRQVLLSSGRVVHDGPPLPLPSAVPRRTPRVPGAPGPVVLRAERVGVVRAAGTPWEHVVLRGADLELRAGSGLRLAGANGSGKSTLAGVLAGLERPSSGRCLVEGEPADQVLGRVGIVFQHARLQVQRPRVADDIAAAAGIDVSADAAAEVAAPWLQAVGLDASLGGASVDELSGGQLRRVALAGVLAARPRVLVLDEPFAGLDPQSREALAATLRETRRNGTAVVIITHDEVEDLWDRTLELADGVLR